VMFAAWRVLNAAARLEESVAGKHALLNIVKSELPRSMKRVRC